LSTLTTLHCVNVVRLADNIGNLIAQPINNINDHHFLLLLPVRLLLLLLAGGQLLCARLSQLQLEQQLSQLLFEAIPAYTLKYTYTP
jgi:hypothetical protein